MKKLSMLDIANEFGVSKVTVSRALNHQPGVSDEMRQSILEYAEAHNYQFPATRTEKQNTKSKAKKNNPLKARSILILKEDKEIVQMIRYFEMLQAKLLDVMAENSVFPRVWTLKPGDDITAIEQTLDGTELSGILVIGQISEDYLSQVSRWFSDAPIICIGWSPKTLRFSSIQIDLWDASYNLTKYVLRKGHSKIAYVTTQVELQKDSNRYLGHMKALMEAGYPFEPQYLVTMGITSNGLFFPEDLSKLLDLDATVIMCSTDYHAAIVSSFLEKAGKTIGVDYSLTGFGNFAIPSAHQQVLTTVDLNLKEVARLAVKAILQFEGRRISTACSLCPRGILIEGDTLINLAK